jgi:hypothetical protein
MAAAREFAQPPIPMNWSRRSGSSSPPARPISSSCADATGSLRLAAPCWSRCCSARSPPPGPPACIAHRQGESAQSLLKEAELHIARGNTPQAVINAIDASADLPEQAVRKLSLAFNGNRLLAMAPSAGPGPDAPRFPGLSAGGDLLATVTPEHGPVRWRLDGGRYVPDRDLQADGLGIHSLVFGDEEQILGVGEDGVWRLPAADAGRPTLRLRHGRRKRHRISPDRTRLAIALAAADGGHGVCVIDLDLPGNILLRGDSMTARFAAWASPPTVGTW